MDKREAIELISTAVAGSGALWADVGAGSGTFTRALRSILPTGSRVYAVDKDPGAIALLSEIGDNVVPVHADFTRRSVLAGQVASLDGLLLANALHFVRDADNVLRHLASLLRPGGRVVIVEYDRRAASPWVPYPIDSDRWPALAERAGLTTPRITARMPSRYAGDLYAGVATRPAARGNDA
jgi:SAM-dependent methyltransferase